MKRLYPSGYVGIVCTRPFSRPFSHIFLKPWPFYSVELLPFPDGSYGVGLTSSLADGRTIYYEYPAPDLGTAIGWLEGLTAGILTPFNSLTGGELFNYEMRFRCSNAIAY